MLEWWRPHQSATIITPDAIFYLVLDSRQIKAQILLHVTLKGSVIGTYQC